MERARLLSLNGLFGCSRRAFMAAGLAALAAVCSAPRAEAYLLFQPAACPPGEKWDISSPVKVRLLAESFFDYLDKRGTPQTLADLVRIEADIRAVIALYNAVPGSGLRLELHSGIGGDRNLEDVNHDNLGPQTIVIGFTDEVSDSSDSAEAFEQADQRPGQTCTRDRAHISFRKTYVDSKGVTRPFNWIFGPPDTLDGDPRGFVTAAQPTISKSEAVSFLGILTHEMGHALGLRHPESDYAVMAQAFKTWFRGPDHVLMTGLLPDDIAGLRALYRVSDDRTHVDVSVTNSWVKTAAEQAGQCPAEQAALDAAADALADATSGGPVGDPKVDLAALFEAVSTARIELSACQEGKNAVQVDNCKVSSRADGWVGKLDGLILCGTNDSGSTYPPVSTRVCPGAQIQTRYTVNNHSMFRDTLAKVEMWLSKDEHLDVGSRPDRPLQSADIRETTVLAGQSKNNGQVFRLPAAAIDGTEYRVFVRAVPFDTVTGASLWHEDAEQWNNAVMVRSRITVDSGACQ